MILTSLKKFDQWAKVQPKDINGEIDGVGFGSDCSTPKELIEWKCQVANKYNSLTLCAISEVSRKSMEEKLLGVSHVKDIDYRTKDDAVELASQIEKLVSAVLILNLDSITVKDFNTLPTVEDKIKDPILFSEKRKSDVQSCVKLVLHTHGEMYGRKNRMSKRLMFAVEGPIETFVQYEVYKNFGGDPKFVDEILRDQYGLPIRYPNVHVLETINQQKPEAMNEVLQLHSAALEYIKGNSVTLKYFQVDTIHTISYNGLPLPQGKKLSEVYFWLKEWPFGKIFIRDLIVTDSTSGELFQLR